MRITVNDKRGTVILLDKAEQRTLRKVQTILDSLAKNAGEDEQKAAEAIKPVVARWATEAK